MKKYLLMFVFLFSAPLFAEYVTVCLDNICNYNGCNTSTEFDEIINRYIKEGYRPVGGVSVSYRAMTGTTIMCQALEKKEKK